jgi:hypothetical protein
LSNDELQYIFKKLAFKTGVTNQKISLSYDNFLLCIVYICLFSLDNFIDTSLINTNISNDVLSNKINYYNKLCHEKQNLLRKDVIEMFFDYLELSLPYNKKFLENYIHIQSGLSHKERSVVLKNKSDSLPISDYLNYYKDNLYVNKSNDYEKGIGNFRKDGNSYNKDYDGNDKDKDLIDGNIHDGNNENINDEEVDGNIVL